MRVVIVKHHEIDDAGFVAAAFRARGAELTEHLFPADGPLPPLGGVAHVIVLGAAWSVYDELAVDVPMARAQRSGKIRIPDGDAQAEMGLRLRGALAAAGFARYEVSNFARGGARSIHNLGYWQGRPYLGLGVGAAGATDAGRYTPAAPARRSARAHAFSSLRAPCTA